MTSQAELKRWRGLSQKKFRETSGRFLVQGRKGVAELLRSRSASYPLECLLANDEAAAWLSSEALPLGGPLHILPQAELDRIGTFEKGNELIAVVNKPEAPPFRKAGANELMLALDGVRDPRNLGSLIRIADWFGIKRLILSSDCMEVFNPKSVQSTMGSLFAVELREAPDLATELAAHRESGTRLYVAETDGPSVFSADLSLPGILVLGSESHGHSPKVAAVKTDVISIPRIGRAESLNVAMAAAGLCMEFARRHHP